MPQVRLRSNVIAQGLAVRGEGTQCADSHAPELLPLKEEPLLVRRAAV